MSDIRNKYTFVSNEDKKWQGIGLTQEAGFYRGVVYEYGKVSVVENEEKTEATLQFDFNVLDSNGLPQKAFGDDFFNLIGDVLQDIIKENIEQDAMEYVDTDN